MPILFFIFSSILIISAFGTIFSQRLINSLLWSILVFIMVGGLFVILCANYNAIVQMLVYVIAIPILIAISIMFTNNKNITKFKLNTKKIFGIIGIAILMSFIVEFVKYNSDIFEIVRTCSIYVNPFSDLISISKNLLSVYHVLFLEFALGVIIVIIGMCNYDK